MKRYITYCLLTLAALCGMAPSTSAQIYDAEGQYVDTVFHDHVNRQADDFVTVSLIVAEPGGVLYSCCGHACLRLQCPSFDLDYIFSYEGESISDKMLTFFSGNLKMGMFSISPADYLKEYETNSRGVLQYRLNLPADAKQRLWELLDQEVAKGPNQKYDYLNRGCAQSALMFLQRAVGASTIQYAPWPEKYNRTRREIIADYLFDYPWQRLVVLTIGGAEGDENVSTISRVIIPSDLVEVLQSATIDGVPVISEAPVTLLPSGPKHVPGWFTPNVLFGLIFAITLVLYVCSFFARRYESYFSVWGALLMACCTLLGCFLVYIVFVSKLPTDYWNWLLIPFNPFFVLVYPLRRYAPCASRCFAGMAAIIIAVWMVVVLCWPHTLTDTAHILLAGTELLVLLRMCLPNGNPRSVK